MITALRCALGAALPALLLIFSVPSIAAEEHTCRSGVAVKNKAILESMYGMFGRGEYNKIVEHVDDRIKWVVGQDTQNTAPSTPWYGVYNGKQEVIRFFETHASDFNALKYSISDFTFSEDGSMIGLRFDITYEDKKTKKKADFMSFHRVTFRDSKVTEFYAKFDTLGTQQLHEPLTTQELKNFVRVFAEALNRHDIDSAAKMISPDLKMWAPLAPTQPMSRDDWKKSISDLITGFPDIEFVVDDIIADPTTSRVTFRHHVVGTHQGAFMGVPPSQQRVSCTSTAVFDVAADAPASYAIRAWWMDVDRLGLMAQIGGVQLPQQLRA